MPLCSAPLATHILLGLTLVSSPMDEEDLSLAGAKPSLGFRPFCSHFAVTSPLLVSFALCLGSLLAPENVAVFYSVCLKLT